jgi:hypothetical protein
LPVLPLSCFGINTQERKSIMRRAIVGGSTLVVGVSAAFWGMLLMPWGDFGCTVLAADEVHATSYGVDIVSG